MLRNSMDPLHQDRKSLGVPIDLSQPPPAHQLSINVELTVLRYRAMHQTPRAVRLNCACARTCKQMKRKDKQRLFFFFLLSFSREQTQPNTCSGETHSERYEPASPSADTQTTKTAGCWLKCLASPLNPEREQTETGRAKQRKERARHNITGSFLSDEQSIRKPPKHR